jgi:hypothetical protein
MGFGLSGAVTIRNRRQHRLGWIERLAWEQDHFRIMAQLTVHMATAEAIWYTHDDGIKRFTGSGAQREYSGVTPGGEQPARVQVSRGSDISIL